MCVCCFEIFESTSWSSFMTARQFKLPKIYSMWFADNTFLLVVDIAINGELVLLLNNLKL